MNLRHGPAILCSTLSEALSTPAARISSSLKRSSKACATDNQFAHRPLVQRGSHSWSGPCTTLSSQARHISSPQRTGNTQRYKSRYIVSRGFAGFCAWTSAPTSTPTVAATSAANSASTVVVECRILKTEKSCGLLSSRRPVVAGRQGSCWGAVWRRGLHTSGRSRRGAKGVPANQSRRDKSSATKDKRFASGNGVRKPAVVQNGSTEKTGEQTASEPHVDVHAHPVLGRIANLHRPTRDQMLAAATGFFQRLRIRTKWVAIRQMRPYNLDDMGAFVSWFFLGHVLWIVLGTTTFLSLAIFLVNTVFAQETLAGWVGDYLTRETGIKVVFESAIVPKWKDGSIAFNNVFVSRRPSHGKHSKRNVRKGSAHTAAAAAAAASHADETASRDADLAAELAAEQEDTNYTQFDVTIDSVNVTVSFARWMNGKGLLKDVEIRGVRGVIDRTHVQWDEGVDPRSHRREHNPGDFEIENFKMEDLLVTVHQPGGFRPFAVSVFNCDMPQLRKQWLFYDFLSADHMSGSFDESLFTIHPQQRHGAPGANVDRENSPWKKTSRLRIDGLRIDHLNRGIEGPFSWIQNGNVDITADVMLPADNDLQFTEVVRDIMDRMEAAVAARTRQGTDAAKAAAQVAAARESQSKDHRYIIMDLRIQLNDVRAAVPLFTKDLSYVNLALVRPIVAYINSRKTVIPINCRVVKRLGEFDGSWTMFDSGLMDDLSAETYEAFVQNVADDQARRRRMKKVGLWSLQLAAQALLLAMAGSVA